MKTKSTSQIPGKPTKKVILLAVAVLAFSISAAFGATTTWTNNGTGSWFTCSNWSPACPDVTTDAYINNGGTAQVEFPAGNARNVYLGQNSGDSGRVLIGPDNHAGLTVSSTIFVGYQGTGTLTISNGEVSSAGASIGSLTGQVVSSNGTVTVDASSGTGSTWTVTGEFDVGGTSSGAGGTGLLTVSNGGTVSAASVHVWNSGTLTGNGTLTTTGGTTMDGTLAPSGTLVITGNLSFGANANMRCNVSSSNVDKAEVSGIAMLNGKLSVTVNATGDFTLLHADGGLGTTKFSSYSFTYTGCLSASIVYDRPNGNVILHVISTCN